MSDVDYLYFIVHPMWLADDRMRSLCDDLQRLGVRVLVMSEISGATVPLSDWLERPAKT